MLGIHSPSRIFRDEVGKWIPAGMAQGIDKASGLVEDSIDGLTDMIPTVSLKTDTSMLETPYAYQTRITGGRMAYTIDSSQGEYATKQDIIDAIDQALSSGITLNLSDRGGEGGRQARQTHELRTQLPRHERPLKPERKASCSTSDACACRMSKTPRSTASRWNA